MMRCLVVFCVTVPYILWAGLSINLRVFLVLPTVHKIKFMSMASEHLWKIFLLDIISAVELSVYRGVSVYGCPISSKLFHITTASFALRYSDTILDLASNDIKFWTMVDTTWIATLSIICWTNFSSFVKNNFTPAQLRAFVSDRNEASP